MAWRVAESLLQLQDQLDELAPKRHKPDGFIGDADHANRSSDHNPWCGPGVVTAGDFSHDPDNGLDGAEVTEALRLSRDKRIKYVIFQGRMFSSYATSTHAAWTWRPYSGINAHAAHFHISVQCDGSKDSRAEWDIGGKEWDELATKKEIEEVVRKVVREEIKDARIKLAVGSEQKGYNADNVNLKKIQQAIKKG